jgi:excisionase family DNA binding protein
LGLRRVISLKDLLARGGLIKPSELAAALNVSEAAVYLWISRRTIPFLELGKSKRFDPDDLAEWLKDNRRPANKRPGQGHTIMTI